MSMSNEELLKNRYEVSEPFPNSDYQKGSIIADEIFYDKRGIDLQTAEHSYFFRKMGWWEKRNLTDLPKYVKGENGHKAFVEKVRRWFPDGRVCQGESGRYYGNEILPATEEEYTEFNKHE